MCTIQIHIHCTESIQQEINIDNWFLSLTWQHLEKNFIYLFPLVCSIFVSNANRIWIIYQLYDRVTLNAKHSLKSFLHYSDLIFAEENIFGTVTLQKNFTHWFLSEHEKCSYWIKGWFSCAMFSERTVYIDFEKEMTLLYCRTAHSAIDSQNFYAQQKFALSRIYSHKVEEWLSQNVNIACIFAFLRCALKRG